MMLFLFLKNLAQKTVTYGLFEKIIKTSEFDYIEHYPKSNQNYIENTVKTHFFASYYLTESFSHISEKKCHTLKININRSKSKRTHFIHVYVNTNLPQHKKLYLIIWLII